MVPAADHDFFAAAAAAVGTLIGLLFVALSVWRERDDGGGGVETHRLRAAMALTVFTNALTVSLFALVPGSDLGEIAAVLAIVGFVSILGSTLRVVRLRRDGIIVRLRDLVFIAGGGVLFVLQLSRGAILWSHPHRSGVVVQIAELTIFFLLFGISRSWELIGGPEVGLIGETAQILRRLLGDVAPAPADAEPPSDPDPVDPAASGPTAPAPPTRP